VKNRSRYLSSAADFTLQACIEFSAPAWITGMDEIFRGADRQVIHHFKTLN
jgi:hypothetical protein